MRTAFYAAAAIAAATAFLPGPAIGQSGDSAQEKVTRVVVYGRDPCPRGSEDEIIVCARKPDAERYRIPEDLRENPNDPVNQSWANRALEMQYVGRSGIGSCSTTGPGGMIGCYNELVRQARAERAGRDSVNWNRLIEEARQERLDRIDSEAEAEEAASRPD